MRRKSALTISRRTTFAAHVPACAMALEVNSNRSSFFLATPQCKRPNGTSAVGRISGKLSMIDFKSHSPTIPVGATETAVPDLGDNVFYRILSCLKSTGIRKQA
jgi:hypothetical protein